MRNRLLVTLFFVLFCIICTKGQNNISDSSQVINTLQELFITVNGVDLNSSSKTKALSKISSFVIYRGDDKRREWKDFANYKNTKERKGIEAIYLRIKKTIILDSSFKIIRYHTEKESEGLWHFVEVSSINMGAEKRVIFAFIKSKNSFGLADID